MVGCFLNIQTLRMYKMQYFIRDHRLPCHLRIKTHKRGQIWTLPPHRADFDCAIRIVSIGTFPHVDIFSHQ